ncbi:MAG: glycosyltransferase family 4 protein [Muribaculaceae bacterium]|nr:glycosyltransferase family 4 protein [Muribaculaceae bacterium]MDE6753316.1 glycosyltransferase family 4 protein [Muribaculaceae bacterium]
MRIVHLVRATSWGGGERYALDLCEQSVSRGHDVTVVTRGIPRMDKYFSHLPGKIKKMPLGGIFDMVSPVKLASLIKSFPEERVVVHVHNFKDAEIVARAKYLVGNKKKVHLVVTRHLVRRGKKSLRWKFIYAGIDRLLFVSQLAKNEFLSTQPLIASEKIRVVHNSIIFPEKYSEPVPVAEHEILNILYAGRVASEKGLDVLIRAMGQLKNLPVRLTVTGTGEKEYLTQLWKLSEEVGVSDRITWTGFAKDVYKEIRDGDICVAPSIAKESFGLTIIEFMSQGRPVITTSNGAQTEIITDGEDGILVEAGNVEALADAIRKLAEDSDLRHRIGEKGAETFRKRFSYDVFFKKIMEEYGCPRLKARGPRS